ncbi:hypothetical protein DNK47_00960 [Mycoplasma wenyonii]|uniref:Uncharacterized protein n=1 Tax=Mycoplasma wenyonii TaxID=65123 RepID=A0A328PK15_9MOLU|nr:hypothetical protein DNK47_00960 [Mycoplasma wenyonii]
MVNTEIRRFFNPYIEDKFKKFSVLFKKYRVDAYLYRKVVDKKGSRDLYKIWFTFFIAVGLAIFIIFAVFR